MTRLAAIRTGLLDLHYFDDGPCDGPAALLLHGWPDDPHTWTAVAAVLNAHGWRTIRPFLRGFGPNRFLDAHTPRSAQLAALADDALALADNLRLERFAVIGHDWGARAAYVLAAQAPARLTHCIALSVGYGGSGLSLQQAQQFWYQWFFAHPQGAAMLQADRRALTRYLWQQWSPSWRVPADGFARTAAAFDNPDWLEITLHGYRHRWNLAEGDPRYEAQERHRIAHPAIAVPTLVLHGEDDRCIEPASSQGLDAQFTGQYQRIGLPGIGHFPQREAPQDVARHVLAWLQAHPHPQ